MTIARPIAAFFTAMTAGLLQNLVNEPDEKVVSPGREGHCCKSKCCDSTDCAADTRQPAPGIAAKLAAGIRFAVTDVWSDIAKWFFMGLLLSWTITVMIPDDLMASHLGGGPSSMLLMLAVGIPIYICATGSTPIAASLILKGASPGTALVFLLTGPATNLTALSVIAGILGRKGAFIYLFTIAACSMAAGLALDAIYIWIGFSADAVIGQAGKMLPFWLRLTGAVILLLISLPPLFRWIRKLIGAEAEKQQ